MSVETTARIISHPLMTRHAQVVALTPLGARMRRVTFRLADGDQAVPWVPRAVGDHLKLFLPAPGDGKLMLPKIVQGRPQPRDPLHPPTVRDYTIRAVPDPRHVVLDMIMHGSGPASTWVTQVRVGDSVGFMGPRGSRIEPSAERYLVLVDETGIPAAARLLEEVPPHAAVTLAIQVFDEHGIVDLPCRPQTTTHWLVGTGSLILADHLRDTAALDPQTVLWAAGEAGAMRAVRGIAKERGLPPEQLHIDGYFRWGIVDFDHHKP